jgi:DNA-binding transcriptional LysR family regulator
MPKVLLGNSEITGNASCLQNRQFPEQQGTLAMTRDAREPSVELLHTLRLFAEHGDVASVAQVLGLDAAVISRRLAKLRTKYGLLRSARRSLELTEKGSAALPAVINLLRQHDQLAGWLNEQAVSPQVLSIATGSFGARFYLPAAISVFSKQHSDWQVRVQVRRGRERILGVADGIYDLAIVSHDEVQIRSLLAGSRGDSPPLRIEPLSEHLLCVLARKDTPCGRELSKVLEGQPVPPAMLSVLPLVGLDLQSGIRRQIEASFRSTASRLCFQYEAGGWEGAKEFARRGLGAAVIPRALVGSLDRTDFIIRHLPLQFHIRDLLIDRDVEMPPAHKAMKLGLEEAAKAVPRGE